MSIENFGRYRRFMHLLAIRLRASPPSTTILQSHIPKRKRLKRFDAFCSVRARAMRESNFHSALRINGSMSEQKRNCQTWYLNKLAQEVTYRPFDNRWTIWDRNVAVHRRLRINDHFLMENLGLIVAKNWGAIGSDTYDGASVTIKPVELNYFRRGGEFIFPIHIRPENSTSAKRDRRESLAPDFRAFIDSRYDHHFTPEEILAVFTQYCTPLPTRRAISSSFVGISRAYRSQKWRMILKSCHNSAGRWLKPTYCGDGCLENSLNMRATVLTR